MQKLEKLLKKLKMLFAPEGTLYTFVAVSPAQKGKQRMYSITRSRQSFILNKSNLQTHMIYSADTIRVANNFKLDETTNIMLKSKDSISFGTGFTVKKRACLSCKIGF
jgi:hypothetical protein